MEHTPGCSRACLDILCGVFCSDVPIYSCMFRLKLRITRRLKARGRHIVTISVLRGHACIRMLQQIGFIVRVGSPPSLYVALATRRITYSALMDAPYCIIHEINREYYYILYMILYNNMFFDN